MKTKTETIKTYQIPGNTKTFQTEDKGSVIASTVDEHLKAFKNNSYEIAENDFLISSIDRIIVGLKYIHSYVENEEIGDCINEMKLIRDTLEDKKPELIKQSMDLEQELIRQIE